MRIEIKDVSKFIGRTIKLRGYVEVKKDHGKLIFVDLRDRTGIIQTLIIPDHVEAYENAKKLRSEFVIEMTGKVKERPMSTRSENGPIGALELEVELINVLNKVRYNDNENVNAPSELDEKQLVEAGISIVKKKKKLV